MGSNGKNLRLPLGSQFIMYTANNPLAYVCQGKLGTAQIRWMSEFALFDFDIMYEMGKSNQAPNALSHYPATSEENSNL